MDAIVLASNSQVRAELLRRCKLAVDVVPAAVDEDSIKASMIEAGATPREIADALAESKARKVASKKPEKLVLGCDQVLEHEAHMLSKPKTKDEAVQQLKTLNGNRHHLLSAAVIYDDGKPVWRHVGQVRLWMHKHADDWLEMYVERSWDSIRHCVGGYKLEEEGPILFSKIEGDYFNVLGLPLLEILSYLRLRGSFTS